MVGAGVAVFAAFIWLLSDQDSRNRLWKVRKHLTGYDVIERFHMSYWMRKMCHETRGV
ncbi:unnamed protein product [Brugia pahangi]|uniref:ABC transmembrane type-1 domain-containing protein n=1 Tax=Brugia pahangi TaxID=6280 RepID=A0A0N4TUN9_BRUPA|nr:unnamed protein product [Brugia pahangi]